MRWSSLWASPCNGVHKLPSMEDYWSQHTLLEAPGISHGMPIRRFKLLQNCLHHNDNTTAKKWGEPSYDKLHKIRTVMESIPENCQWCYSMHSEVPVDETMVVFKGRSSMKQYCPMKPTKRGYKVLAHSDSHTGYVHIQLFHLLWSYTRTMNFPGCLFGSCTCNRCCVLLMCYM